MTIAPQLPAVASQLTGLASDLRCNADGVWLVTGPATAGKTALLRALASELASPECVPIFVSPPTGQLDSGAIALVDVGAGLKKAGLINGSFEEFATGQMSWSSKLAVVRSWFAEDSIRRQVVLLCDEPAGWAPTVGDEAPIGKHALQAAELLMHMGCRRVVAGLSANIGVVPTSVVSLKPESRPGAWLRDENTWGELSTVAADLATKLGSALDRWSPLQIRLMVGLSAFVEHRELEQALKFQSRRELSRTLASVLGRSSEGRAVRNMWAKLALVRIPFDSALLQKFGCDSLSPRARAVVQSCLLYEDAGHLVMHDMLRVDAREGLWWSSDNERVKSQELLAQFYANKFRDTVATDTAGSLRLEMEAYHHWIETGGSDLKLRVFFGDQLDARGRALSLRGQQCPDRHSRETLLREAASVFREAIRWDDQDDYAHHYYAYNFDLVGTEIDEVRNHYLRAIELSPTHVWWRYRYVNFLLALGLEDEARRAWDDALDGLGLPNPNASASVYEELHLRVARLLLHRGRLPFAAQVLDQVPEQVRSADVRLSASFRRLLALLEAHKMGAFVPGPLWQPNWWQHGPVLLPPKLRDGRKLKEWVAGRVHGIRDGIVYVDAARVAGGGEPTTGTIELSREHFDKACPDMRSKDLSAGRFLELGKYTKGSSASTYIRVHAERPWETDLPALYPDPTRYIGS